MSAQVALFLDSTNGANPLLPTRIASHPVSSARGGSETDLCGFRDFEPSLRKKRAFECSER